jgi:hypothetical protein
MLALLKCLHQADIFTEVQLLEQIHRHFDPGRVTQMMPSMVHNYHEATDPHFYRLEGMASHLSVRVSLDEDVPVLEWRENQSARYSRARGGRPHNPATMVEDVKRNLHLYSEGPIDTPKGPVSYPKALKTKLASNLRAILLHSLAESIRDMAP